MNDTFVDRDTFIGRMSASRIRTFMALFCFAIIASLFLDSISEPIHENVYYQDCLVLKNVYGVNIFDCVEYAESNPDATSRDVVDAFTGTMTEKLLDKPLGQP